MRTCMLAAAVVVASSAAVAINQTQVGTCQLMQGQDCFGSDMSSMPSDSPDDCCAKCSSTPGCAAFTHNQYNAQGQQQGTCYMKSGCDQKQGCGTCTAGTTTPAAPTPPPAPTPPTPTPPTPPGATLYCPGTGDWQTEYGSPQIDGSGWTIHGGARVGSKASFNLLGGYIEWDMDTTGAQTGVNNNFYVTSPDQNLFPAYCDIQGTPGCLEMDFIENNGNCIAQTTWHTQNGAIGRGNCDRGGCGGTKYITGGGKFHMKASFSDDGWMTVTMDGDAINPNPTPNDDAKSYVHDTMASVGAQIHSSQWVGWTPGGNCGGGGSLDSSTFAVSNIKIMGAVVQGAEPQRC